MTLITGINTEPLTEQRCISEIFQKEAIGHCVPSYKHHPVAFITCDDTYRYTQTHNKKLGVLGTKIMTDKLFFSSH